MTLKLKKGIAFLSTFPPRACGIATYTTDLMAAISDKFNSYNLIHIPISDINYDYQFHFEQNITSSDPHFFEKLTLYINTSDEIDLLCIQHEFGLFKGQETGLLSFLLNLNKPIVITFHTVLPFPNLSLKETVKAITDACDMVLIMTKTSADILLNHYHVSSEKIMIIPHGTHLAPDVDKEEIRKKFNLTDRKVLSTFGLLGPGKSIETTLEALPAIINKNPKIIFLILGVTHPEIVKQEGERYRNKLIDLIDKYNIAYNVRFVNEFLSTKDLLSYLQITDVYLFTSKDINQAVSGTFSYALSSGCPIISTPIPHALEVLKEDMGIIVGFEDPVELAEAVDKIFLDTYKLQKTRQINLQNSVSTCWQNTAVAHVNLFESLLNDFLPIKYAFPPIKLDHLIRMTTEFGFVQFANNSTPDLSSGYTLDDNARALIVMLHHYKLTESYDDLLMIQTYLQFIAYCIQEDGKFLNYVDVNGNFTNQNHIENLEDANGRAIWALGELIGMADILPENCVQLAKELFERTSIHLLSYHSTRSMAFIIKGLYFSSENDYRDHINTLADRLLSMYNYECSEEWQWFESYLTYGNSVIPEAMLIAYQVTGNILYAKSAYDSFDFLLSKVLSKNVIQFISNNGWEHKNRPRPTSIGGEQPIEVAYTILALNRFFNESSENKYKEMMVLSFDWFLGRNHLNQIIYNPVTGGCFDGLEADKININQGAESTLSYLMARMVMETL